jgi:osmotically-inducible protein OsmY
MADYKRNYENERYGRGYAEDERYDRGWRGRDEERGFFNRAGDEVRSWFGDHEAERRRRRDEREDVRRYGRWSDRDQEYGRRLEGRGGYGAGNREAYGQRYDNQRYESARGGSGDEGRYGQAGWRGERENEYGMRQQNYGSGYGSSMEPRRDRNTWPSYGSENEQGYGSSQGGRGEQAQRLDEEQNAQNFMLPYWSYSEIWIVPGPHTGRGPSDWQRSDESISEDVNERLQRHDQIDATNINVKVENGEVTLSGTVNSRLEKRLAADLAEDCSGVKNAHNNLRVASNEQSENQKTEQPQQTTQASQTSGQQARSTAR